MAEESAKLRIPYIAAAQAQKHVTHNEGMTLLDTLVQLSVLDKDLSTPPGSPAEGDTYIVAAGATGAWIGWDKRIARFIDGTWRSYLPGAGDGAGWLAYVIDESTLYVFTGTEWEQLFIAGGGAVDSVNGETGAVSLEAEDIPFVSAGLDHTDADDVQEAIEDHDAALDGKAQLAGKSGGQTITGGTAAGDGLTLKSTAGVGTSDFIKFLVGNNGAWEAARFLTDGRLLQNLTTPLTPIQENGSGTISPILQCAGNGTFHGMLTARFNGGDANGVRSSFLRSRASTVGVSTVVQNNDMIGIFLFNGADGSGFPPLGYFGMRVDGTPGTNDMPGRFIFATTPDGSSTPAERLRINNAGVLSHRADATVIVDASSHLGLRSYTVGTLPSAATAARLIYVSDGTSNKRLAVSDGTDWRFPDGNVVS